MSITAMYSDYVLPVADHYEREDFTMEGRTPFVHAISEAVPPLGLGEPVDLDLTAVDVVLVRVDPPVGGGRHEIEVDPVIAFQVVQRSDDRIVLDRGRDDVVAGLAGGVPTTR